MTTPRDMEMARRIAQYVPRQQGPAGRTEPLAYEKVLSVALAVIKEARADEREECARAGAGGSDPPSGLASYDDPFSAYNDGWCDGVQQLRDAIRARGEQR